MAVILTFRAILLACALAIPLNTVSAEKTLKQNTFDIRDIYYPQKNRSRPPEADPVEDGTSWIDKWMNIIDFEELKFSDNRNAKVNEDKIKNVGKAKKNLGGSSSQVGRTEESID